MTLTFRINKPTDFILDYLTDMQKFVSVHPVINRIKRIGNNRYLVFETLKLGSIPVSFTYPVTVESKLADKTVIFRATVLKLTKIEMTFVVQADRGFSVVEETIRFSAPLPVKAIMQRIFRKQHEQLFKNLALAT